MSLGLVLALGFMGQWAVGRAASADEPSPEPFIRGLGALTGNEVMQGQVQLILADKKKAHEVLQTARALAEAKKHIPNYNAAVVLAEVASELKDLKNGEFFFRLCAGQAVKLQSTRKLLQSYGGLIDLLYENKKYDASARICRELLELKTDDGKPRIYVRAVTTQFGDTDIVEDDSFDPAKGLRSGVHRLLIQAIAKQGKVEQALKLVENLIRANDHWLERQLKAWVLREAGRFAEAAQVYQDVIERVAKDKKLDPADRDSYQDRYRYILSNVYVDMEQIDKASEQLQALIKRHPDDPGYYNDLGYIWADRDLKLPEAEELIRKALDLDRQRRKKDPKRAGELDNGAYLDSLGWVLFKQKKYKEAKEALVKAVEDKKSQHIEIYDHLGDVHMILGERDAALAAWRKGLEVAGEGRRDQQRRALVEKKLQMNK
jgi:tetratricopeptide (TPR) repeat protein